MKNNISTILNVVLLIAVAVLFYLHFSTKKEIAANKAANDTTPNLTFRVPKNLAGARVLYINIDSINANYLAFADLYRSEGANLEQEMQSYQNRVNAYQRRADELYANNGANWKYSADSAAKEEEYLKNEERNLTYLQQKLNTMQSNAMEKNEVINDEVSKYFKSYSQEKGIDFILAIGQGSPVIYANDSLDITKDVVQALNEEYQKKNSTAAPAVK